MASAGVAAKRVQSHPASQLIFQISALIGGVAALFILVDVIRRVLGK